MFVLKLSGIQKNWVNTNIIGASKMLNLLLTLKKATNSNQNEAKKKSQSFMMEQKGMTFDHDFYVVVGKQCRTQNAYTGHQHNIFI